MPGPKMGPRPADFNEAVIRASPTFKRWETLERGEKLRYACRDFIKGHDQDEERLMRRIMIARRNNIRDHEILKRARRQVDHVLPGGSNNTAAVDDPAAPASAAVVPSSNLVVTSDANASHRKRRPAPTFSDPEVAKAMDVPAVEATRSYRAWAALQDGEEFTYNQKYVKGKEGHDWLLRKNIWRRMRYRRENKKMVTKLREDDPTLDAMHQVLKRGKRAHQPQTEAELEAAKVVETAVQKTVSEIVDRALSPLDDSATRAAISLQPSVAHSSDASSGTKRPSDDAEQEEATLRAAKIPKSAGVADVSVPAVAESGPVVVDDHLIPHHFDHDSPLEAHNMVASPPPTDDDPTHAALTAAAAATASGADDLVELSAVEAAVAAAASYVELTTQNQDVHEGDNDVVDFDDSASPALVHNPLEAAANAAALDSAAKLAAAAAAQEVATQGQEDPFDAAVAV